MTSATSLSRDSVNVRALKPAIVGKFIDASTPLAFMSRTRSWTSKQPGRSSEKAPGLKPHSSRGQPTVAAMPNGVEVRWPWNTHSSTPCSLRTTLGTSSRHLAGTWFSYMSGGSMKWSSMLTRIMSSICMKCSSSSASRCRGVALQTVPVLWWRDAEPSGGGAAPMSVTGVCDADRCERTHVRRPGPSRRAARARRAELVREQRRLRVEELAVTRVLDERGALDESEASDKCHRSVRC